jgi:tetratricopeptide (TPR) repeat protein
VFSRIWILVSIGIGLAGCGGEKKLPVNRQLVVRRFENLGPDRQADGLAAAASEAAVWRAMSRTSGAVDEEQSRQSQAGLLLRGQLRPAGTGKILFTAQLQDRNSSEVLEALEAELPEDDFVPASCRALEKLLRVAAGEALTGSCGTQAEWMSLSGNAPQLEEALAKNPKFYPAFVRLAQLYARSGNGEELSALLTKLGQPSEGSLEQFVAGQVRLVSAKSPGERAVGYAMTLGLRASDTRLREEAAEAAQAAGDWTLAAGHWKRLVQLEPERTLAWNSLGYAEAQLGRTGEAVRAILEYQKRAPGEANPLDSLGEVQFMGGKFRDAAISFDELNRKYPNFQNRAGFWKAAVAWFRAGDLAQADGRHNQWMLPMIGRAAPSAIAFQRAYWLARTGRAAELKAFWEKELAESSGERKTAAELHCAAIEFGLTLRRPPDSQFVLWSKQLQDPALRQNFSLFGLLSDNAGSEAEWRRRLGPAGQNFVPVAMEIWAPLPATKRTPEALPENPPGILEALRLRRRTTS